MLYLLVFLQCVVHRSFDSVAESASEGVWTRWCFMSSLGVNLTNLKESLCKSVLVRISCIDLECQWMAFWSLSKQDNKDRGPQVFCFEKCTNIIGLWDCKNCNVRKSCDTSFDGLFFFCPKKRDIKSLYCCLLIMWFCSTYFCPSELSLIL